MNLHSAKAVEAAKDLLKYFGYFVDTLWHVNDIHFICEQKNLPKLSDTEAMEVFAIVKNDFEGEYGISWPALDKALCLYIKRKELNSSIFGTTLAW